MVEKSDSVSNYMGLMLDIRNRIFKFVVDEVKRQDNILNYNKQIIPIHTKASFMNNTSLKLLLTVFVITLFSLNSYAQNAAAASKDGKVKVMIMEDVLFKGIIAANEAELIDKKIEFVNKTISDKEQIETDSDAEDARKTALLELRKKLEEQKNKVSSTNPK